MTTRKIAFVYRDPIFSPNNVGNDAHILNKVAEFIKPFYPEEEFISEADFSLNGTDADVIVDMCRSAAALDRLIDYQRQGRLVINSGFGIINCFRDNMTRIMQQSQTPMPTCLIVNTNTDALPQEVNDWGKFWVKRGKGHSMVKNDIISVNSVSEAEKALKDYRERDIDLVVLSEHIEGDLVKFYGIRDSEYFFCFYPAEEAHSKFGQELLSPKPHHYAYSKEDLYQICQKLSEAMDLDVFGGDCIIDKDHGIYIIDFNDWPSFAPCLEDGARHIANHIMLRITEHFSGEENLKKFREENKDNNNNCLESQDNKNALGTCH